MRLIVALIKIVLTIIGLAVLTLGIHGLYAYFSPSATLAAIMNNSVNKLFFSFTMPSQFPFLAQSVDWMTHQTYTIIGLPGGSWGVPAGVCIAGLLITGLPSRVNAR